MRAGVAQCAFFRVVVSDCLADDGFADRFAELRSDVAISCCARAGDLERGPGVRSSVPVPPAVLWSGWFPK
jgi:hypothetical protein